MAVDARQPCPFLVKICTHKSATKCDINKGA